MQAVFIQICLVILGPSYDHVEIVSYAFPGQA